MISYFPGSRNYRWFSQSYKEQKGQIHWTSGRCIYLRDKQMIFQVYWITSCLSIEYWLFRHKFNRNFKSNFSSTTIYFANAAFASWNYETGYRNIRVTLLFFAGNTGIQLLILFNAHWPILVTYYASHRTCGECNSAPILANSKGFVSYHFSDTISGLSMYKNKVL